MLDTDTDTADTTGADCHVGTDPLLDLLDGTPIDPTAIAPAVVILIGWYLLRRRRRPKPAPQG